jgi:hypothetical protein
LGQAEGSRPNLAVISRSRATLALEPESSCIYREQRAVSIRILPRKYRALFQTQLWPRVTPPLTSGLSTHQSRSAFYCPHGHPDLASTAAARMASEFAARVEVERRKYPSLRLPVFP